MSWSPLELMMKTRGLWDSPAQFAVFAILAFKERESRGFAFPHREEVAALIGVTERRVSQIYAELEAMGAISRLGQDWEELGGRNRYVLTLDKAVAKKRAQSTDFDGALTGERVKPISPSPGLERVKPISPRGEANFPLEGEAGFTQGCSQFPTVIEGRDLPKICKSPNGADAPATAPPRLPLPPAGLPKTPAARNADAVKAASERARGRLYRRVAGLARSILLNPDAGAALVLEAVTTEALLVDATKVLAARKRVAGYGDVVHAACAAEWFKHSAYGRAVLAGTAPRPRDLARAPR